MPRTIANVIPSQEVPSLDRGGFSRQAKASASPAESHAVPEAPAPGLGGLVEIALTRVYGSKKAAAIEMGKDRSQLRRQLELGTLMLRELDSPMILAELGAVLQEEYGGARKSAREIAAEQFPQFMKVFLDALKEGK